MQFAEWLLFPTPPSTSTRCCGGGRHRENESLAVAADVLEKKGEE